MRASSHKAQTYSRSDFGAAHSMRYTSATDPSITSSVIATSVND
jgi:hypothetical protein